MNELAALAIAEMSTEMKAAFLNADEETQVKLALAFAQDAADKQTRIANILRNTPHKMEAMKEMVYTNLAA